MAEPQLVPGVSDWDGEFLSEKGLKEHSFQGGAYAYRVIH